MENDSIIEFARDSIKQGLAQLEEKHHTLFKRMYSHDDLSRDIYDVVDAIPVEKLDNALSQVERTLKK